MLTIVDDGNMGFALGAADYFTKPIDWKRLGDVCGGIARADASRSRCSSWTTTPHARDAAPEHGEGGMDGSEAENGRAAWSGSRPAMPAIILLDLMMPEMDGFEFMDNCAACRRSRPSPSWCSPRAT